MSSRKILVAGVDGGPDGLRAAEYAARMAMDEGVLVRLVHAYQLIPVAGPMVPAISDQELRDSGAAALAEAGRLLAEVTPTVSVSTELVRGSPAAALVHAARTADLVVVGRSSAHGLERLLTGSTSTAVAAKAPVPVVSVPQSWSHGKDDAVENRVLVGVDGSIQGRDALAFAFAEAERRGASLMAVRVCEIPPPWAFDLAHLENAAPTWLENAELALAEDLAGWREKHSDVPVVRVVERSKSAAQVLIARSQSARLVVIGARGHGGLVGLDMGLTARNVLAHAHAPVAVVHRGEGPIDAPDLVSSTSTGTG
jgi:nucleotide-binding universal stress UspA family protein